MIFSCGDKDKIKKLEDRIAELENKIENKDEGSLDKEITNEMRDDGYTGKGPYTYNIVISFSITSKNLALTSKEGTEVSINKMTTKNLLSGEKIIFKNFLFTLDNKIEDALNFYSKEGKLMCDAPTELSVMSMPPDGNGATTYKKGDSIEFSEMSLITINSIKFVISDIKIRKQ